MEIESLVEKARNDIGPFCMNECGAKCCRKGTLIVKKESMDTVTQGQRKELENKKIAFKLISGDYALDFNKKPCPSLRDNKCTIYQDPLRPKLCHEFPLFIKGNSVWLSSFCTAVQEKKFDDLIGKLKERNVKVVEI